MTDPVALPCRHVGCKKCLTDHFKPDSARVCPAKNCKDVLPENYRLDVSTEMKLAVKQHADFRKKMSQFFIEVLQQFVFRQYPRPHQDIVDQVRNCKT